MSGEKDFLRLLADFQKALAGFDFKADLHRFSFRGMPLVLDVVSGAVHLLDPPAWDFLAALEESGGDLKLALASLQGRYSRTVLGEVVGEFVALKEAGLLFTSDPWRGKSAFSPREGRERIVKSLCLHVAHECNLRCAYCFGSGGSFGGQRGLMSAEVARAAVDFVICHSAARRQCEIDFFGGEPLLNFDVVKETVRYARQRGQEKGKEFQFTLTTNCLLLNKEILDFLNRENINLILSLDGRPEVHNRWRCYADGSGSHAEVLASAREAAASRQYRNYYIRGTFTRFNLDFTEDVRYLVAEGFNAISLEPVVAEEKEDYSLTLDHLPRIEAEYEKLAAFYLEQRQGGNPFSFFHFELDLEHSPCLSKRLRGCGAGCEYLAVSPQGDIYPCHQFVGRSGYHMGNVLSPQGLDWSISERFAAAHIYNREACSRCWARFYCGGGCHANADAFNHSLHIPYAVGCALQKRRWEAAIYLEVQKNLEAEGWMQKP